MNTLHRTSIIALLLTSILIEAAGKTEQAAAKALQTQQTRTQATTKEDTRQAKAEVTAQPDMKAVFEETIAQIKKHPNKQNLIIVIHLDSFIGITPISDEELKKQEEQLAKELAGKAAKEQEEIIKKAFQQRVNALILTEPAICDCVKQLQKLNIKVIGITDVIPPVAEFIAVRLKQLGLDFNNSGVSAQPLQIPVGTNLHALYKNGVLYAGNIGYFEEGLTGLLKKTKLTNKQILFIARFTNDSNTNTQEDAE